MGEDKFFPNKLDIWSSWKYTKALGGCKSNNSNGKHVGDLVSIDKNATLWNGQKCEKWYLNRNWYITKLEGNKAVLGKDESGKYSMISPISTSFLTVEKTAEKLNQQ